MKVLITGISGFLATYLSESFLKKNYEILGLSHAFINQQFENVQYLNLHLPDNRIYDVIKTEQPDVVIHAAGTASVPKSVESPYEDFSISVPGTAMLLDALRLHKPDAHFIFFSSAAVYGNPEILPITENSFVQPISPYGFHKRMGELLCEEYSTIYGLNTSILRIFSAYGKGLNRQVVFEITRKLISSSDNNENIEFYGTGDESRDFIHASDIVQAVQCLIQTKKRGFEIYNCASGKELLIKDLALKIKEYANNETRYVFNGNVRKGDPLNWTADISKMQELGFTPQVNIENGIQEMIMWVKDAYSN